MGLIHRVTVALRTVIGVANRGVAMPSRRGVRRTRHHAAAVVLETLEDRALLSASSPSAGLVPTAGISPAAEVASQVSTGRPARLAKIETLAKLAYIWGLPAESVYRFSKYNQLVTAPLNTLAYNMAPAAWNNAATNAGNASVLYFYAALDLTRTDLVYTIPSTNADFQITQILDNFTNVVSDPGTRTFPTNDPTTSFLLVGPNSPYAHKTDVTLKGFTFTVIALDTNRGEMLLRLFADTLAPASSENSVSNIFKNLGTQFTLNTLKQFQSNGNKPVPPASYNRTTPTPEQIARAAKWQNSPTNAVVFFKQMGQSLRLNPLPTRRTGLSGLPLSKLPSYIAPQADANRRYFVPASGQQSTLALFRSIGLTQNGFTIPKSWGAAEIAALQKGFEEGQAAIQAKLKSSPTAATNYWSYINQGWGTYANTPSGYVLRAGGVIAGGFPNLPVDALYAASFTNNASLTPLDGNNTYSLTFLPPQSSYSSFPVTGILPPLALNSDEFPDRVLVDHALSARQLASGRAVSFAGERVEHGVFASRYSGRCDRPIHQHDHGGCIECRPAPGEHGDHVRRRGERLRFDPERAVLHRLHAHPERQ